MPSRWPSFSPAAKSAPNTFAPPRQPPPISKNSRPTPSKKPANGKPPSPPINLSAANGGKSSAIRNSTLSKNNSPSPTRISRSPKPASAKPAPPSASIAPPNFPPSPPAPASTHVHASGNRPYIHTTSNTGDFVLPIDFSYEVDLWGRVRRTVAAAREEAQATTADYATASLSLHAELAIDYFELRSADAQKQLLDDTVKAYTDALQLTSNRFQGGVAPKSDVAQAQTQLDTTRVQDTDVTVARAQFEHAIAILIGKPPAELTIPPTPLNAQPPVIPGALPSELLERRPDIAAAERRMAEANQQIGIARAAYFPTLSLSGSAGFEGTSLFNWFSWPSRFWAVGPQLTQTLFDGGRRRANSETALANYDGTVATYRQTTLTAFQEVEDNLAALRILTDEDQQQTEATTSAQESLQLFTNRYKGGVDTYLQVINAQTIALQNERNNVDIQRRRMDASVLLIKALGGGWSTAELPKEASIRN